MKDRYVQRPYTHGPKRGPRSREQLRCFVDHKGRQHFNFRQEVWLDPAVAMAYTKVASTALTTLAANLLALALAERDRRRTSYLQVAMASRFAVVFARRFSEECLLPAPDEGWVMPCTAIRAWLVSRLRGVGLGDFEEPMTDFRRQRR